MSKVSGTKPFSNTAEMWNVIAAQAAKAVEGCGFDGIISTGAMLQNLRTSGLNNSLELTRDGYHMDYGIARYGASCTVFETIIGPYNGGLKLDSNSFRTSSDSKGTTAITDERAAVALKAARYAIAKPYEVTDMKGEGGEPQSDILTISTAAELTDFATRVNNGEEAAVKATVTLSADIDLGGVEWTPIGNGTAISANSDTPVSGNAFCGSFDGGGHKVNITIHASSSATYMAMGGVVGTVFSVDAVSTARNLSGHANLTCRNTANTNNGAANFQIGGVVGFTQGRKPDVLTLLDHCVNYADITAEATRLAGVVGTMNGYTQTIDCVNNGNIVCTDTKATDSRPAGIVSAMGDYTYLTRDVNNGDISFAVAGNQTQGYAAGIVGQTNDSQCSSVIDGCASYGTVQSDIWLAENKYMGIICATFYSKTITVRNCIVGGKIGPYTVTAENPLVTLTADNFAQYYTLAPETSYANVTFEGNQFGIKP